MGNRRTVSTGGGGCSFGTMRLRSRFGEIAKIHPKNLPDCSERSASNFNLFFFSKK